MYKIDSFFLRPRVFLAFSAAEYAVHSGATPAGFCGTCSGRSKSNESASNHRITFHQDRAKQVNGNPELSFSHFFPPLLLFLKYHSIPQKLSGHGTIAAHQAFPFVTATSGAAVCACVCVCVSYSSRNREAQFQLFSFSFLLCYTLLLL